MHDGVRFLAAQAPWSAMQEILTSLG